MKWEITKYDLARGFFYIEIDRSYKSHFERLLLAAREFFNQPEDIKTRFAVGTRSHHRGYVPFSEKGLYDDEHIRAYEAFDIALDLPESDPDYMAGNILYGPNLWPKIPGFRRVVSNHYEILSQVAKEIFQDLSSILSINPNYFPSVTKKPTSQLRLIHYIPTKQPAQMAVDMGAHTDYEFFTILSETSPGIEIESSEKSWLPVEVGSQQLIVMFGDLFEVLTNGEVKALPHRVKNEKGAERFSFPYFAAADYHAKIQPLKQFLSRGQIAGYQAVIAGEHLEKYLYRDFQYLRIRKKG